jgi:hypothetical protein
MIDRQQARSSADRGVADFSPTGWVTEPAACEKVDRGYLGEILMLTLLAPDIVEAILDGRQPAELGGRHVLREGFPVVAPSCDLWPDLRTSDTLSLASAIGTASPPCTQPTWR